MFEYYPVGTRCCKCWNPGMVTQHQRKELTPVPSRESGVNYIGPWDKTTEARRKVTGQPYYV